MHILTTQELERDPHRLLDDAQRGQANIVTRDDEPVLLTLPLGHGEESRVIRMDIAASLYDRDQITLGMAARVANLSYSEMIDELGRRGIATMRLLPGDLERELAAFEP